MSPRDERAFRAVEAMLAHLHPKEDTAALVRKLEDHFASADALFRANPHMLEDLGVRPEDALLLSHLPELSRLVQRARFEKRPKLGRFCDAAEYLIACFHGLLVERFYMFCLDASGKLKAQILLHEGLNDGAMFNLRKMLYESMRLRADAVIISHNHPGLTLRPSQEDIDCTQDAIRALSAVGIPLLDHVIIAERQAVSLRQNGFVHAHTWLAQKPGHRLLCHWLDGADDE